MGGVDGEKQPNARYHNLDRSVSNLNVLVPHVAADHEAGLERMICIFWNFGRVVMGLAPWAVDQPPAEASCAKAEDVIVAVEVADVEVVADDEGVEAEPEGGLLLEAQLESACRRVPRWGHPVNLSPES